MRGKHLLIVPSGPLTQLPFQVLVSSLPNGDTSGLRAREVARGGIDLGQLSDETRRELRLVPIRGVAIVRAVPGGPAEIAGIKAGDVLLSVDGEDVGMTLEATTIQPANG
jgi:S1-C subfamily serine protease